MREVTARPEASITIRANGCASPVWCRRSHSCRRVSARSPCTVQHSRVHPDLWYWPSRSHEQIFYGKKRSPRASKGHQMPYHVKKQYVLQEGAWVVPNGVRGCATISTLFPTAFSLSNSLRMPQLQLTVNLQSDAPGGPSWPLDRAYGLEAIDTTRGYGMQRGSKDERQ